MTKRDRRIYEREIRWHGLFVGAVRAWLLLMLAGPWREVDAGVLVCDGAKALR